MKIFLVLFANSLISLVSANSASSVFHPEGLTLLRWRTSSAFLRSRFSLQSSLTPCSCSYFHPARLTGCSIIGGDPPRASPVFSKIDECSEAQGIMFLAKFPGSTLHTSFIFSFLIFMCSTGSSNTLALRAALGAFVATTTLTPQVRCLRFEASSDARLLMQPAHRRTALTM